MKKFISGIIVGAGLMMAVTVSADVASLVGKQIEGTFPVFLDGKKLENETIVVQGTSYAPVRSISEALGLGVEFENEQILLSSEEVDAGMAAGTKSTSLDEIERKINAQKDLIENQKMFIGSAKFDLKNNPDDEALKGNLAKLEATLIRLEEELTELERQKAELEKVTPQN